MPPDDRSTPLNTPALDTSRAGRRRPSSAYRQLVARGLEPSEAANLTAYIAGIPIGDHAWTLGEVNNLVFLRRLHDAGAFGPDDGHPPDRVG